MAALGTKLLSVNAELLVMFTLLEIQPVPESRWRFIGTCENSGEGRGSLEGERNEIHEW